MVAPGDAIDPLLKRPFSLHRIRSNGAVEIVYRVMGRGTELLAGLEPGSPIEILGPLGNGFPRAREGRPVLVGGGLGIVPLVALGQALQEKKPRIVVGARNRDELLSLPLLRKMDPHMTVCTDDGSEGLRGRVPDALVSCLESSMAEEPLTLYACGPYPMLKALQELAARKDLPGFVSMEEHMACGLGACMGCVAPTVSGYRRVCREGPVFPLEEVKL